MTTPTSFELKAFVPAKDFEESKRFYVQLGFDLNWEGEKVAHFVVGESKFLLQDHYVKDHADNFMMFLLVEDVEGTRNRGQITVSTNIRKNCALTPIS